MKDIKQVLTTLRISLKEYIDEQLKNYAKTSDIPTKVSQLLNDSAYLKSVPLEYITETELNNKGYLTEHQSLSNYYNKSEVDTKVSELSEEIVDQQEQINRINGITGSFIEMTNLYNPALQTANTISPHYYVAGVPYSSTQYDANYNATALIEVEPNKKYTIALIPSLGEYSVPWARAPQGLFFYDANKNYIDLHTDGNTFTTPSNAKYIRFNYAIVYGINLSVLNARCVLVEGETMPPSYIPYGETLVIQNANNETNQAKMFYQVVDGGIYVNAPYSSEHDISYYLCKHGANSIFDFYRIGLVDASSPVSNVITPSKYIVETSGDWHAPYVVKAVNNADGENPSSSYFTGGNHGYDNTATGVPTGRTDNLKMYADGKEVAIGTSGYCDELRFEWDNYVQGYNTTKADGSGREILREHITMCFDGYKWTSETTIYPLESIKIQTWYGLQLFTVKYDYVAYINGSTGLIYEQSGSSESGNAITNAMRFFNLEDTAIVEFDTMYDLGTRRLASTTTKGFFARGSYNKAYGTVIEGGTELASGGAYSIRGSYIFKHEIQQTPAESSDNTGSGGDSGESTTPTSLLSLNRTQGTTWTSESNYINPAKYDAITISGTACVISNQTENSITVEENGTGGTGVAFPFIPTKGKSYTLTWDATGTTDTRFRLMMSDGSNLKNADLDNKSGAKTSATISVSSDGKTVTVNGTAIALTNAVNWIAFFFGCATGKTVSYKNVTLKES